MFGAVRQKKYIKLAAVSCNKMLHFSQNINLPLETLLIRNNITDRVNLSKCFACKTFSAPVLTNLRPAPNKRSHLVKKKKCKSKTFLSVTIYLIDGL